MCFINYALRLGLISIAPSPWWILPIEFCLQGPTYALTYTTIVEYANVIAPPGASATMQGIAAGMDDGFGKFTLLLKSLNECKRNIDSHFLYSFCISYSVII